MSVFIPLLNCMNITTSFVFCLLLIDKMIEIRQRWWVRTAPLLFRKQKLVFAASLFAWVLLCLPKTDFHDNLRFEILSTRFSVAVAPPKNGATHRRTLSMATRVEKRQTWILQQNRTELINLGEEYDVIIKIEPSAMRETLWVNTSAIGFLATLKITCFVSTPL